MAVTTSTTRANNILNEVLASKPLAALTPKLVYWNLCNQDSIDGAASLSKEYPVESDIGAASAATEGTDLTSTTTLSMGATVTVTPTEAAAIRSDITTRSARRESPGMTAQDVFGKTMAGDLSGLLGLLESKAMIQMKAMQEKAETDVVAQLDDFSNVVGTSTQDLSIANMLSAIYTLEAQEPEHENFAFVLHPQQVSDIRTALLGQAAASASAGVWVSQADASFVNFQNDAPRNGLKGSFLGIPVYQTSPSVNPLPNAGADVAGALVCVGQGAPDTGIPGATVFVEGHAPLFLLEVDASARTIEMIGLWEYGVAELRDKAGVSIITDAP